MKKRNTSYSWKTGDKILEVNGLNSLIDGRQILTDISMDIRMGEITAILGSSGSGKTTLLKHLLGIYPSDLRSTRDRQINWSSFCLRMKAIASF